jgi:hypothetical protein
MTIMCAMITRLLAETHLQHAGQRIIAGIAAVNRCDGERKYRAEEDPALLLTLQAEAARGIRR